MSKSNIVCSTARSGSNLLCGYIESLKVTGAIKEWLNPQLMAKVMGERLGFDEKDYENNPQEIFTKLIQDNLGPDNSFTAKIHYIQFYTMMLKPFNPFSLITNAGFVHIVRRDIIAQAISYEKADQQKAWSSFDKPVKKEVEYNFERTLQKLKLIIDSNDGWTKLFQSSNVSPLVVFYEELEKNPQKVVGDVLTHWGYAVSSEQLSNLSTGLKRQTDNINMEWRERFEADLKANNIKIG